MNPTHRSIAGQRVRVAPSISRRDWLRLAALGVTTWSTSGWFQALAEQTANDGGRRRSCILLWMTGGPSQLDTFDLKSGHANAGPFQPIDTSVPGIRVCEHLPKLAKLMEHVAPIRSMSTKEGDHTRATYLLRTGYLPQGPIHYPTMGSFLSKELGDDDAALPNFVSVSPFRFLSPAAYGPGFLGPKHAPLVVGDARGNGPRRNNNAAADLAVKNLKLPDGVDVPQADARLELLHGLEDDFNTTHPSVVGTSHRTAYSAAVRMMRSEAVKAFSLDEESDSQRDAYGRNSFGQGCLLARRLVERGVPFVEVSLNAAPEADGLGWDTHTNNFDTVKKLCGVLDPGWATLIDDLKQRGMLDSTLIVWMGEFGRTPQINRQNGRDHFPTAWTAVLAGGGVRGGQVVGETSPDGMQVKERAVAVPDFMATVCRALGIDPKKQNVSNVGRPIRLAAPEAQPVLEVLL